MDFLKNSLKDWEDNLNDFRFLFRYERELIAEGFYSETEFLELFLEAVDAAAKKMELKK